MEPAILHLAAGKEELLSAFHRFLLIHEPDVGRPAATRITLLDVIYTMDCIYASLTSEDYGVPV